MKSITWVNSNGGPLIVLPAEIASHWRGIDTNQSDTGNPESMRDSVLSDTDYGRACSVDDYLGVLSVGPGKCLVLGDEPMQTTFLPTDGGGLIVRWMYAESEEDVLRVCRSVPQDAWDTTPHSFSVGSGGLLIFDSAYSGDDLVKICADGRNVSWMRIPVSIGIYEIDTADYKHNNWTRLILHRLRRSRLNTD